MEYKYLFIGIVGVGIGVLFLTQSIKQIVEWRRNKTEIDDAVTTIVKYGEPKRLIGAVVLLIIGSYFLIEYFAK